MSRCCGCVAHLGDADICVFALLSTSSGFLMYLECYSLSPKMHGRVGRWVKRTRGCIGAAGRGDVSAAVLCYAMYLTVV
jgi:hypothetical protein